MAREAQKEGLIMCVPQNSIFACQKYTDLTFNPNSVVNAYACLNNDLEMCVKLAWLAIIIYV